MVKQSPASHNNSKLLLGLGVYSCAGQLFQHGEANNPIMLPPQISPSDNLILLPLNFLERTTGLLQDSQTCLPLPGQAIGHRVTRCGQVPSTIIQCVHVCLPLCVCTCACIRPHQILYYYSKIMLLYHESLRFSTLDISSCVVKCGTCVGSGSSAML